MASRFRVRLLLAVGTALIAGSIWVVAELQRRTAVESASEGEVAHGLIEAVSDQEKGLRAFILTRRDSALATFYRGRFEFDKALEEAETDFHEGEEHALVAQENTLARGWQRDADRLIARIQAGRLGGTTDSIVAAQGKRIDDIRELNHELEEFIGEERDERLEETTRWSVFLAVVFTILFAGLGELLIGRSRRRETRKQDGQREYRETQREFTETMQVTQSESEAYLLLQRHLERTLPDSNVLVLNRNNSDNRLEAVTSAIGDELKEKLIEAEPQSCLAIRMGRAHEQSPDRQPLLACELCAGRARTTCVPSLVGGEVIGAVNVSHAEPLEELDRQRINESVNQAAPALANLRNLQLAESRAATDALTGLPNNRALYETLKRYSARASRTLAPLTAVALDIDHFKSINDQYGHETGDAALAALGDCIAGVIRTTDFAARSGGEEFVLLLPDTPLDGGMALAEKLRVAIKEVRVPGVESPMTASFGVASIPENAGEGDALLRAADRALYVAKGNGRDRVEVSRAGITSPVAEGAR